MFTRRKQIKSFGEEIRKTYILMAFLVFRNKKEGVN